MNPEQEALVEKASTSLRAARLLAAESLFDIAVSRAYYAMFYVAQAFLLEDGLTFSRHSAVIAAFGQRFVKTGRIPAEYHRFLIEGMDSRNVGDYGLGVALSKEDAAKQIERGERFLSLAQKELPGKQ